MPRSVLRVFRELAAALVLASSAVGQSAANGSGLELARIPLPAASAPGRLDGVSLGPLLFERCDPQPRDVFWGDSRGSKAVRRGPWKLVLPPGAAPELYRLDTDIGENRNLAAAEPERVNALKAAAADWERAVARPGPSKR